MFLVPEANFAPLSLLDCIDLYLQELRHDCLFWGILGWAWQEKSKSDMTRMELFGSCWWNKSETYDMMMTGTNWKQCDSTNMHDLQLSSESNKCSHYSFSFCRAQVPFASKWKRASWKAEPTFGLLRISHQTEWSYIYPTSYCIKYLETFNRI